MDQRGGGECFEAAIIGVTLAFLSAIAVAGYQIYVYLKHGTWLSISVVDGFLYITQPNFPAWLLSCPTNSEHDFRSDKLEYLAVLV